jgi:hypothetical protein
VSEVPNPIVIPSIKAKDIEHHPDSPLLNDEHQAAHDERKRRLGFLLFFTVETLLLLILL